MRIVERFTKLEKLSQRKCRHYGKYESDGVVLHSLLGRVLERITVDLHVFIVELKYPMQKLL